MQCTSYLPVCYSTRDRNVGANGSTWPPDSSDRTWKNGDGYNVLFSSYTTNQYLGYDMGVLKQTMLKHEATFRNQVQELHRLYRRQRELMDEIKRTELSKHHLQLQTSLPSPFFSQIFSESAQEMSHIPRFPWVNPTYSRPSVLNTLNFQAPSSFAGKSMQASLDYSLTKSSVKDTELLLPKSKKFGKRKFNLELPADEYIDSEEGERFDDEKVSEVPELPYYPSKKISEVLPRSDSKLFLRSGEFNSACQGVSRTDSFFRITNDLVDLNEPVLLEEAGRSGSNLNHILQGFSPEKIPRPCVELQDQCRAFNLLDKSNPKLLSESTTLGLKISERNYDLFHDDCPRLVGSSIPTSHQLVPQSYVAKSEPFPVSSLRIPIGNLKQIPTAVQALPCSNTPVSLSKISKLSVGNSDNGRGSTSEHHDVTKCFEGSHCICVNSEKDVDLNFLPSSCLPDTTVSIEAVRTIHGEKRLEDSSVDEDIENREKVGVLDNGLAHDLTPSPGKSSSKDGLVVENVVDNKLSGFGNLIDLNSCINEDESFSVPSVVIKSVAEIDLEAPVSPENTECSPPRGVSEEQKLETPIQLSKQEDCDDPRGELATIAAEAIVSISSYRIQLCLENATNEPSVASIDCLDWFAGIVSSIAGDLENEVETVADGDQKELLLDGIDYFEAMTLKLTETKVEEFCCKSNGQKENETGATLSSSQPRRGRLKAAKQRKDFQTEVLPCLASLSRHEVTEDLQTIGGLMEAAGTPLRTGLGRRNGRLRGRKRSSISPNNGSELWFVEGCLSGWGKKKRRQRGPRCPASNPSHIFRGGEV